MKRSFSIICLAVLFCSCADFLSETDPNAVTTESYYINTEDVEMSVRGCYNALYFPRQLWEVTHDHMVSQATG